MLFFFTFSDREVESNHDTCGEQNHEERRDHDHDQVFCLVFFNSPFTGHIVHVHVLAEQWIAGFITETIRRIEAFQHEPINAGAYRIKMYQEMDPMLAPQVFRLVETIQDPEVTKDRKEGVIENRRRLGNIDNETLSCTGCCRPNVADVIVIFTGDGQGSNEITQPIQR